MISVSSFPADMTSAAAATDGPPILFVHGFASVAETDWPADRWGQPLASRGRGSIVAHLPGHPGGPALTSADQATADRVVAGLAETVRSAGVAEIDVVGYSLGARLAWDLASAGRVSVRRLVLGGLSPVEPFDAVDVEAARAFIAGGTPPADPLTAGIAGMVSTDGNDAASLLYLIEGLARQPFDPAATPPQVPTLFVAGEADPMSEGIDAVADRVSGSRIVRVPGDHPGALASSEFRDAVFEFLGVEAAS